MSHIRPVIYALAVGLTLTVNAMAAEPPTPVSDAVHVAQSPNATIGLIAGGPGSTDARIAAEIAQVVDDGDRLRVLPMMGHGSEQNIADLIYLKGVDVAIVHADVLAETMRLGSIAKEGSVQYIAELFQEEVHVLARKDITSLSDLNGKPVSIGSSAGATERTADAILEMSNVRPTLTHEPPFAALERLRRGEIAAMFVIGGKPVPLLQGLDAGSGLHLLAIPLNAKLVDAYVPTAFDHQHYPNLVPPGPPIDTVAVGSVLVTLATSPDSLRAKRVNRFVDAFFERFDRLLQPGFHPKWQEVNVAAQVAGWARYPEALNLLKRPDLAPRADLRNSFNDYVSQSGQTTAGIDNERREALFRDFLRWRSQHSGP